jgi:hypothetical protein
MNLIIKTTLSLEEALGLVTWIERVPSQSNPSEILSGEKVSHYLGLAACPLGLVKLWKLCLGEHFLASRFWESCETSENVTFTPHCQKECYSS